MERIADLISQSERPLVWAGHGIRLAGETKRFREFIERTRLPCVTTWGGADLLPTDHPQNVGIVGVCGQQGANRAVAACDFLLVLGSHLSAPQTGPLDSFAPNARRIAVVDIDQAELDRIKDRAGVYTLICAHLSEFFGSQAVSGIKPPQPGLDVSPFRPVTRHPDSGSYALNDAMTRALPRGTCIVIDGGGTALYTGFQSSYIKEGSRLICSMSMSAMGSGLPEAVGSCLANGRKLTTCLIGDGSLMLNLQELQTISTHRLPIKIFVVSNGGYLAIRHTQKAFQDERYYGVGGADLQFPKLVDVARTFGIYFIRNTKKALNHDGPAICEWICSQDQPMLRQGFKDGKPLPLTEMVIE